MSVTHLILRERGPHTAAQLPGCQVIETSVEQLAIKPSARSALIATTLGSVVLEDLRLRDLSPEIQNAIGGRDGISCPVVTRWSNPRAGNAH